MLSESQITQCLQTISCNTFYFLVKNHLETNTPMSVVRMGDGEVLMIRAFERLGANAILTDEIIREKNWVGRMGFVNISLGQIYDSLKYAAENCTYFAPNVHGINNKIFSLYDCFTKRSSYVDNFFVNEWNVAKIKELYSLSNGVILVHRNEIMGNLFETRNEKNQYIKLTNFDQADGVIHQILSSSAQLVLLCGAKHIGPKVSLNSNKVVLDIGNSIDRWMI